MGGSRAQVNKPHKTRFSSKSSRNVHKISLKDKHRAAKSECNVAKGGRAARIQRNKMIRDKKRTALLNEKRSSSGSSSPPRVIVLFGLSAHVDLNSLEKDILTLLSSGNIVDVPSTVASSEYKLRATVLKAPHGNLLSCIKLAKVADLIAFVVSVNSSFEEDYVDSFGIQCLSVFRAIGFPATAVLMRNLPGDPKRRHDSKKSCASCLSLEFPEDCKFYAADTKDELHKFMWLFKEQRLIAPHWRSQRAYLTAQKVDLIGDDSNSEKCTLLLTGYLHARSLSVNQLVHVSGAGDFQLCKLEILKDPFPLNPRKGQDLMDADDFDSVQVIRSLMPDCSKQEPLLVENVPDPLAGEQTWPTEAEMAEAEKNQKQKKPKRRKLPQGTSEYQAAWILDDTDEDDLDSSDNADEVDEDMVLDEETAASHEQNFNNFDFDEDDGSLISRDSDRETDTDSVMMDGENLTREQIEDEIKKLKDAHAEEEEFPDEVDTPLDIPARKRFAKYRGLKSFRTSSWDPKESLPPEYARIFAFDNFSRTQKHVFAKALELEQDGREDCIPAGSYARLHIKEVPVIVASKIIMRAKTVPIITSGLLQHESKMSVLHFSIKKHDTYDDPIKGKEELLFHVGFREFIARPIFSSDNLNSDKHKMERFLHAGRFSVASIYAPISFAPLPLIALKCKGEGDSPLTVAAVGSLQSINPDRIILKKIILTGYPQRVSKFKAMVRYMFHNPDDVRWFKPVEVWTKCGRRGRIKEPVGTHGAMKCVFNGVLQQHDTRSHLDRVKRGVCGCASGEATTSSAKMSFQRRRHHSNSRLSRLLPTVSAVSCVILLCFAILSFLAPPPPPQPDYILREHGRRQQSFSYDSGVDKLNAPALSAVPASGGKSRYDIWSSRDSEFFYGCSNASNKFARADSITHSNRYLLIATSGGLNQQRTGIIDAVVAARILNSTLVVPKLDQRSYWKDASNFGDIFDVYWFISFLSKDVKIVKELPKSGGKVMSPYRMRVPRKCNERCYEKRVLPVLMKRHAVELSKFDYRLANRLQTDLQKLRCRVNYHALKFTNPIHQMGKVLVQRMKLWSQHYIALHLRFEPDMLAFSGCYYGGGDKEIKELGAIRRRWKTLHVSNPDKARRQGRCPLTPEEVGLMLRALGYGSDVHIYVASGEVYGGEDTLAPLKSLFPNFHSKDTIASKEDLEQFSAFSSRMAALDFIVCDESDVFVTNNNGNMAKILAGRRRYFGHKPTIRPNAKKLYRLFASRGNMTWEEFASKVRTHQRGFMGAPNEVRPGRGEFHENPSTCICENSDPKAKRDSRSRKFGMGNNQGRRDGEDDDHNVVDDDAIDPDYDGDLAALQERHQSNETALDYDGFSFDEPELEDMLSD
ncbi:hypothetical protein Nepgr_006500 [Nepenthes gracilis]|uniref:O-fucosyltransferase family protein n=1 Tax=Nepenthes gracilis TaxID=150966 RepID=A0AAD3S5A0_NEPGR|nr:hypothetical protein Nepgr_006500 [Nepenthes gracilis]